MRLPLAIAVTLALAIPASAQPGAHGLSIARGIICDTPEQAERFIALRSRGSEPVQALQVINREANKPGACGEAIVAFRPGEPVEDRPTGTANIVQITVLAFSDGARWSQVPATVQYAVVVPKGIDV
jgi:hypothetical protein